MKCSKISLVFIRKQERFIAPFMVPASSRIVNETPIAASCTSLVQNRTYTPRDYRSSLASLAFLRRWYPLSSKPLAVRLRW